VTIHSEHPFATPAGDRDPLRRFRGRTASAVSVWTSGAGRGRAGWTVSSFLVADGDPGEVVGVLDEDSALGELLADGGEETFVVNLLAWEQRGLADAFAGLAPAPGGVFRLGTWSDTDWGPALAGSAGWLGARLRPEPLEHAGWGLLVRARVEHVELPDVPADGVLVHLQGRYRAARPDAR
jgi:flavin reductase (DIM6/NTAB) family NADH-FMN oxidoreductase RutF